MICVPIMARDNPESVQKMASASALADLFEIRLDAMESFDLQSLIPAAPKPVIVTYRSKKEGGLGLASYETRVQHLKGAIEAGADYVDVEFSMPQIYRQEIFQKRGSSRLIVSTHFSNQTPERDKLEDRFRRMAATGADVVKLVTYAQAPEDTLRVLGLMPLARDLGIPIIAFCMGPAGRISRIFTLILGGFLTFASLEEGQESASGQIPIKDMKTLLNLFV
jgi:3-dehydroquinate dehydratase type I